MDFEITFPGGSRVSAIFDDFVIETDQPVDEGGDASAPEPYTLFLASIGTCSGIYVLNYLKHHDLPTEGVRLHQRVHFNTEARRLDRIEVEIEVPANTFKPRVLRALERSANLCAVKRAMMDPPEFMIATVEKGE